MTGGQENTEVTPDTGTLSFGKIDYSCFKLSTGFALTWETLHWNIEGEDFEDHLVRLWREAMRRDLEILALRGDTSSADDFLKLDDGWVAQLLDPANGAHIVDFHDDGGNPQTVDATLFQKAIKALEKTRNTKRRELFDAQDAIDERRESLIAGIEKQLKQRRGVEPVFCVRWEVR